MIKRIVVLISIYISVFSCNSDKKETHQTIDQNVSKKQPKNIQFDFTPKFVKNSAGEIEVNSSLLNTDLDTVYFLSSSCNGIQYSLQYDTSNFSLIPFNNCEKGDPIVIKIAPQEKFVFKTYFRSKQKVSSIKLGYDLYQVDPLFNIEVFKQKWGPYFFDIIHYRDDNTKKNVIWTDTKKIGFK